MLHLALFIILFLADFNNCAVIGNNTDHPKLLLISLDTFRWNFFYKLSKEEAPNYYRFSENGVRVKWIENVFPTVTWPNHMSIATGLYPVNHGFIHNRFFDSNLNKSSPNRADTKDSRWIDPRAEPIWITNTLAGNGRRSGSILWPLSNFLIKGHLPDKTKQGSFDEANFTATERIDLALNWLTDAKEPVNFVAAYFPETDHRAHVFGPDSQEVLDSIKERDNLIGYLKQKMKEKDLEKTLNVIITGDHGHESVFPSTSINLDELVDPALYTPYPDIRGKGIEAVVHIWPKEGHLQELTKKLKHINLKVAIKGESDDLKDLNYTNSSRIAPIVLIAQEGWTICTNVTLNSTQKGQHGYDPRYYTNMYPLFLAMGPAFKKGVTEAEPFRNLDIYPLMCHILGLQPAPNNGSLENVKHILAEGAVAFVHKDACTETGCVNTNPRTTDNQSHNLKNKHKEHKSLPGHQVETEGDVSSNSTTVVVVVGVVVAVVIFVIVMALFLKIRRSRYEHHQYKTSYIKTASKGNFVEEENLMMSDEDIH